MKGLIVNLVAGGGLFAGALFGALAATGRLNHDGVANIPILNLLFPAPPVDPNADPHADPHARPGTDGHAAPADAHDSGKTAAATDAGHAAPVGETAAKDAATEHGAADSGQEPQGPPAQPLKRGRSLFEQEAKGGGGHGGGGEHGADEAKDKGHGGGGHDAKADAHGAAPAGDHGTKPDAKHAAERDFDGIAEELAQDRVRYAPGGYFRFDGMPSGLTPEKLNEAWVKVQTVMADLDKRAQALDLREKELREFGDDIARRQTELGKERLEVESMQRQLDERIEQFQQQVKLVRTDEVAGLTRNAQTLSSFEPSKAVELIKDQWRTEAGQDEVLKTLEFMDKEAVDAILAAMDNALVREVMQKRLKISKSPATPATPAK